MSSPHPRSLTPLLLLVSLLVHCFHHVLFSDAAWLDSTRHPIKINPGPLAAMPTPTAASHTFSVPDPVPSTPARPGSQAQAIRASKQPGQMQLHLPPRSPANFTLPPPLLSEWQSERGSMEVIEVDVRFDEMCEEALWRRWDGDCMQMQQDNYHYTLCPFQNITQRGLQLTSLNVVLGSVDTAHTYAPLTGTTQQVVLHSIYQSHIRFTCFRRTQCVVELVDDVNPSTGNELHRRHKMQRSTVPLYHTPTTLLRSSVDPTIHRPSASHRYTGRVLSVVRLQCGRARQVCVRHALVHSTGVFRIPKGGGRAE